VGPREAGFCSGGGRPARLVSHVFCPPTSASFVSLVCCSLCMLSSILSFMKRTNRAGACFGAGSRPWPRVRAVWAGAGRLAPCLHDSSASGSSLRRASMSCLATLLLQAAVAAPRPADPQPTSPPADCARSAQSRRASSCRALPLLLDRFFRAHPLDLEGSHRWREAGGPVPTRTRRVPRASSRVGHRSRAF